MIELCTHVVVSEHAEANPKWAGTIRYARSLGLPVLSPDALRSHCQLQKLRAVAGK